MAATATRRYIRAPHTLPSVGDALVLATGRLFRVIAKEKVKIALTEEGQRGKTDAWEYTLESLGDFSRYTVTHALERCAGHAANGLAGAAILSAEGLGEELAWGAKKCG